MLQQQHPVIYGISPSILPRPNDYPPFHRLSGYWFLEEAEGWQPPSGLQAFIQDGSQPIYIGFGSMDAGESRQTTTSVLAALKNTGQRAVLLRGWGGIHAEDLPGSVFLIDSVPHSWLFPKMAAIVHHGGAGTTASAFRAGAPQVILPHFGDQPLWAQRVTALKAGPKPIYMNKLTAHKLTAAIDQAATNPQMRQSAKNIGLALQPEDGVATAVQWINQILDQWYKK
jgi:UDP:flavonoid glycosyltransferase YjiC (YdhE family)